MVDYFRKELYKRFFQNAPSGDVRGGILGLWGFVCSGFSISVCGVCRTKVKEPTVAMKEFDGSK